MSGERASLERVSLASVAREELSPWSAGAGSRDSPNLPDSPLTHLRAWDKASTLRASLSPPPQVLPGLPEISSICLFKGFKPSRRSVSEETLVVEFRGII